MAAPALEDQAAAAAVATALVDQAVVEGVATGQVVREREEESVELLRAGEGGWCWKRGRIHS